MKREVTPIWGVYLSSRGDRRVALFLLISATRNAYIGQGSRFYIDLVLVTFKSNFCLFSPVRRNVGRGGAQTK